MAIRVPIMPSSRPFPLLARLLAVPVVAVLVPVGVWAAGGQITNDFRVSMALTAIWFGAAGTAAIVTGWRWRPLALPVVGTFLVVSTVIGVYLALSTFRDRVVNEQVVVGTPAGEVRPGGAAPVELATGTFVSGAHETSGTAAIVELPDGGHVLTLTEFETSPGPDLRVYLVPGGGEDVSGFVDLGGLKGNKGSQQYEIPPDVDVSRFGAVVVWCRAFSVNFGRAALVAA